MESQRSFLVIGLLLVSFLLWQQWQMDYGPQPAQPADPVSGIEQPVATTSSVPTGQPSTDVPVSTHAIATPVANAVESNRLIKVKTDTLDLTIDTLGGDVITANLVKFPVEQGSDQTYSLLRPSGEALYVAQSGLVGANGPDASPNGRPLYNSTVAEYKMTGDSLVVPLVWTSADGLKISKNFEFKRGSHTVSVSYQIDNNSAKNMQFQQYAQLKQSMVEQERSMFMPTYRGGAYSSSEEKYEKFSFDDMQDKNLGKTTEGGWVGMLEHYFVSAWIPPQEQENNLYSKVLPTEQAIIGFTGSPITVAAGNSATLSKALYLGPKDQDTLAQLARGLDLTVDYGVLWWISQPLFALLQFIQSLVTNWGLAIIFITVIVKGLMYPLTKAQYESMAKMRALAPKMQALKERYGDDRQKMSQAMMEMYKKEKANPMGGCFPLLLQMPIFLALYWVLLESVELRHASFLWINDLSVMDPYFVLPILTGASMWMLQKLQPMTTADPMQQKIMQFMPVMMTVFFLWFPSGLVLYWLISNVITLVQAKIIYASMAKRGIKTS